MNSPSNWTSGRLKHLALIRNGQDYKHIVADDGPYPVYGSGGVFARADAYLYDGKSVLFGRKGTIDKPRLAIGKFWTVDTMFYSEIAQSACPEFVYYIAKTIPYNFYSTSTALPSMTQDDLKNHAVSIPPLVEQRQIAAYLHRETAKIDRLIAKQDRLIELLREKRQAVVSRAVTKGLDLNVKMKDSGVEWLGELPAHWSVVRVKNVTTKVKTGGTPSSNPPEEGLEQGINWFSPGDFKKGLYLNSSKKKITADTPPSDFPLFPSDSIAMVGIGATIGKVAIGPSEPFSCNQQINVLVPSSNVTKEFLTFVLINSREQIRQYSNSSTIGIINQEKTKELVLALPALSEQREIVGFIEKQNEQVEKLTLKAMGSIKLLKEHRQALISAAVTGKIDVRGLVTDEEVAALDAKPEEIPELETEDTSHITEEEQG